VRHLKGSSICALTSGRAPPSSRVAWTGRRGPGAEGSEDQYTFDSVQLAENVREPQREQPLIDDIQELRLELAIRLARQGGDAPRSARASSARSMSRPPRGSALRALPEHDRQPTEGHGEPRSPRCVELPSPPPAARCRSAGRVRRCRRSSRPSTSRTDLGDGARDGRARKPRRRRPPRAMRAMRRRGARAPACNDNANHGFQRRKGLDGGLAPDLCRAVGRRP
jgi:hypothetical protein